MRALYLAGTAAAAVTILTPALSYADCREDLAAFNARVDSVGAQDGPKLTSDERGEIMGMRSSAESFASSGDERTCQRLISRANTMLSSALDPQVIQPEQLEGMDVRGRDDEDLGEVDQVRVDPRTGRLAYLMIEYGGFAGVGEELAAVPWALVHTTPEDDFVRVDVTKKQIESAPRWSEDIAAETTPRDWAMSVHSFYGVPPYWRSQNAGSGSSSEDGAQSGQSGQSGGDASSASGGQSGGQDSSAGEGGSNGSESGGSNTQAAREGSKEIVAGIDRLVDEISELRVVLTKSLENDRQASSGQAAGAAAQSGAQSGAGETSGSGAGEQPAEDDATSGGAPQGGQSGGSQSQGSSASGSDGSSGQSGAASKQESGADGAAKSESGGSDKSGDEDK